VKKRGCVCDDHRVLMTKPNSRSFSTVDLEYWTASMRLWPVTLKAENP
jgi:hypothetical protein